MNRTNVRTRRLVAAAIGTVLALGAGGAHAGKDHGKEHTEREHAAHAHGHGTLNLVAEGNELLVELIMPAVNVVGFEHAPEDDTQRAAVATALATLRDASAVIGLPADAGCTLEEAHVELEGMEDDHARKVGDHAHGGARKDEAHTELHAEYHFHCDHPQRLGHAELRAFDHLHDAEEIEARAVIGGAQRAQTLRPSARVLELGG